MTDHEHEPDRALPYLCEQLRHGSLVIFVGAGVSCDAGLPGWGGLLKGPFTELDLGSNVDLLDAAQFYVNEYGSAALMKHLYNELATVQKPGALHAALAALPTSLFFTTNFDQLLERAIEQRHKVPPDVIIDDTEVGLIDEVRRTTVVKLHGCLSLPRTIVLTREDFTAYAHTHPAMVSYLQTQLATRTVLFVGFSLSDPNFHLIYGMVRRAVGIHQRTAYVLDAPAKTLAHQHWSRRGIKPLLFDSFDQIPGFLLRLGQQVAFTAAIPADLSEHVGALQHHVQSSVDVACAEQRMGSRPLGRLRLPADDPEPPEPDQAYQGRFPAARGALRALLERAMAVDALQQIPQSETWSRLGRLLYRAGDADAAIRSFHMALRPGVGNAGAELTPPQVTDVMGHLARAAAYQGQYGRAERLLRRCIFRQGQETPDLAAGITAEGTAARLDVERVNARSDNVVELAYVLARRVETLRSKGHRDEGVRLLCEARYLLRWFLAQTDLTLMPRVQARAHNYAGKCLRLSASLALEAGKLAVCQNHKERAIWHLREASRLDPQLPFPYAHLLHLRREVWIADTERATMLREVRAALASVPAIRARLQAEFPEVGG